MWKAITFIGRRLWELATSNSGQIAVWLGGSGLMFYLGSITQWAQTLGPLGWALIAVASMFLVSLGFALWSWASVRLAQQSLASAKAQAGKVNVLSRSHENERINASDFYSPFFIPIEHVSFTDCELLGPASVYFIGGTFDRVHFVGCEIVIVRPDRPVKGVTSFRFATFLRGRFIGLTLLMNLDQYNKLPDDMKAGVPVISDGRVGDI
jgi:hypothetical protein